DFSSGRYTGSSTWWCELFRSLHTVSLSWPGIDCKSGLDNRFYGVVLPMAIRTKSYLCTGTGKNPILRDWSGIVFRYRENGFYSREIHRCKVGRIPWQSGYPWPEDFPPG